MTEPSEADRAAAIKVRKASARAFHEAMDESSLKNIFSTSQLKRLNQWCKKHDVDRCVAISEIIEAGMKAKGIAS